MFITRHPLLFNYTTGRADGNTMGTAAAATAAAAAAAAVSGPAAAAAVVEAECVCSALAEPAATTELAGLGTSPMSKTPMGPLGMGGR